ncbi:MAG: VanW family protein [Lachnospiraceae bacterium]|nr:VanW family protein [Lachnospiraceae bacterium]
MSKRRIALSALVVLFVFSLLLIPRTKAKAGALSFTGLTRTGASSFDEIAPNVTIGGVNVGGMNKKDAENAVRDRVRELQERTFVLKAGEKSISACALDFGLSWKNTQVVSDALLVGKSGNLLTRYKNKKDLEQSGKAYDLLLTVDDTETAAFLNANAGDLAVKAENAGLIRTGDGFEVTGGLPGQILDVQGSTEAIRKYVEKKWDGSDAEIELATTETPPEGTREQLLLVKDVLGSFHTDYSSSSSERAFNVEHACGFINGSVVYPGEEFSVYDTIGPTDETNGYKLAGAYENGQTVQAYGGGVCQVSSTLYNAVLNAELEVVKRSPHSMTVAYVEPARDAAIAGDYKNFIFRNTTDAPIYIEGWTEGRQLNFTIFGHETRPANRTISFESVTTADIPSPITCTPAAEPIGYVATISGGHAGKEAELWKIIYEDGVEVDRVLVNQSSYRSTPKTVAIGTHTENPEAAAAMGAAFATGNYDTIMAAVNQYRGAPAAPAGPSPEELAAQQAAAEAAMAAEMAAAAGQ